ncbi:MAG: four helix bundle protein [Muribaculaceae bacterium]|nr:four helix bundle protein [Muribaculaceae bacterium]
MQDFKKIDVWKRCFKFSTDIYKITSLFPNEEKFGITDN